MGKKNKLLKARKEYFNSLKEEFEHKNIEENYETEEEIFLKNEQYNLDTTNIIREKIFNYLESDNSQICEFMTFKNTLNFVNFLIK
tara:strand:+ start:428 stop:685 length:258 start_codon:yes stop_codon:yes gene_type:complete